MLNDRKVAEVSNVPSPIIPVVDVHGRVVQVSLTGVHLNLLEPVYYLFIASVKKFFVH